MKKLILYYSYGGNTRKIAKLIQNEIGADIAEIETVIQYTGAYDDVVEQGQQEVNSGFMPEIKDINVDLAFYDCIIIGSPVWWYTFAPAIKAFLTQNDLSNKLIYPFATNGGWIGHTFSDFKTICPASTVKRGLDIEFSGSSLVTSESEIKNWIKAFV